jgi:dihydroflavonol-4-reductase
MSTVLVTGATGLLGSALTRRLHLEGFDVRILRRRTSKLDLLEDVVHDIEHAVGDITDAVGVAEAMEDVDRVYHAAARVAFGGRRERAQLLRVNVDGTATVVNAAVRMGVDRLLHVSSMAAFGRPERGEGVIDEQSEWQRSKANSSYSTSKYLAELEVRRGIAEGLDAVIINPALMFGTGRAGTNTRRLVDQVRSGRLPALPSGATSVVDVLDVVEGALRAMEESRTGERYFLGSENLSWSAIISELAGAFDVSPPRFMLRPRPAMALAYVSEGLGRLTRSSPLITRETARTASRSYRFCNAKARAELGWSPRPFSETAQRLAKEIG